MQLLVIKTEPEKHLQCTKAVLPSACSLILEIICFVEFSKLSLRTNLMAALQPKIVIFYFREVIYAVV